ncbi:MAG: transglycosylase SLT domain-containing protein [Pseudomonadota bacterium]
MKLNCLARKMSILVFTVVFSASIYAGPFPKAEQPVVNELDVKLIKQKILKTTDPATKNLLQLSLTAAYYKAEKYPQAYSAASVVGSVPYLEDYVDYYKSMSALKYLGDAGTLRKNLDVLYKLHSRNSVLSDSIDDVLPEFEAKTALALAVSGDHTRSMEYISMARKKGYSDIDTECSIYKRYLNSNKKLAFAFFMELYSRFGEQESNKCFDTLDAKSKQEILSLLTERSQKETEKKEEKNVPDLMEAIKKSMDEKDYSLFKELSAQYLKMYPQGKQAKRFYQAVQSFMETTIVDGVKSVSYFEDMFEYYNRDYLEKISLKLLQNEKWSQCEWILRFVVEKYPLYDRGVYLLAVLYEDNSKKSKAMRYYKSVVDEFPKSEYYPRSLFKYAWLNMLDGEYKTCAEVFSRYLEEGGDAYDWDITASLYFRAKCLSKSSRSQEADIVKQDLISRYPFSFYSLLSMDELGMDIPDSLEQSIKHQIYDVEPISVKDLVTINRAVKLVKCGLFEWVKKELPDVNLDKLSAEYIEVVANLYKYANLTDLALNAANKLLTTLKGYTSREHAETHFPKPYFELVDNFSKQTGIEPYVIFAVMKRESAFNKDAVSSSGALGLMQLMPGTAAAIEPKVRSAKLKDAETNIRIASEYLKRLSKKYHGNIAYIAAAYNAGEEAMDRWKSWFGSSLGDVEFVENIPYLETRMYVKNVMANYFMYNALYLKKHVTFSDATGR